MSSECTILWFIAATVAAVTKVSRDTWFPWHRFRLTWMTSHGDRRSWSTDTTTITTRTRTFASYASSTLTSRWDYISFIFLNVLLNKLWTFITFHLKFLIVLVVLDYVSDFVNPQLFQFVSNIFSDKIKFHVRMFTLFIS